MAFAKNINYSQPLFLYEAYREVMTIQWFTVNKVPHSLFFRFLKTRKNREVM
jgi:hypothetical protein